MHRISAVTVAIVLVGTGASAQQESEIQEIRLRPGETKRIMMNQKQPIAKVDNHFPKVCRVDGIPAVSNAVLITGIAPGRSLVHFQDTGKRTEWVIMVVAVPQKDPLHVPLLPEQVEISFLDGSIVRVTPKRKSIEMETKKGPVSVAWKDLRSIDFGLRFPGDAAKRIAQAVAVLGSSNFRDREQASKTLAALGPWSYSAVLQTSQTKDAEVARRAKVVLEQLRDRHPERDLKISSEDRIITSDSTMVGRIQTSSLEARSEIFGDVNVPLALMRSLRAPGESAQSTKSDSSP